MLISINEASLSLKGYSRTCHFNINNISNTEYTSFQIKSYPQNQFIIIPENGALMPGEQKQIKLYLSRNSMKKQNIQNCYLNISAWRLNQNNVNRNSTSQPQKITLPIFVSSQYSTLKTDLRSNSQVSRNQSSKYGSFNEHSQGNILKSKKSRDSSIQSSISVHSNHQYDISPLKKPSKNILGKTHTQPITSPFVNQQKFLINNVMNVALSSVQMNNKQTLMQQQVSLRNKGMKVRDNNIDFIILCLFVSFFIIIGSYLRLIFNKF